MNYRKTNWNKTISSREEKLRANGKLTLAELKRRHKIAVLKAKKVAEHEEKLEEEEQLRLMEEENPIEQEKIFGDEDFKKIKALRTQSKIDENLEKMGAKKVKNAAETDLTRLVMRKADRASERRVNPDALAPSVFVAHTTKRLAWPPC